MKELMEDMDGLEKEIDKFIQKFEEDLELSVENKLNTKLLERLYNNYLEEHSKPSEKYYYISREEASKEKELLKNLTKEQKLMLEKVLYLKEKIGEERELQSFIYGFCIGNRLKNDIDTITRDMRMFKD